MSWPNAGEGRRLPLPDETTTPTENPGVEEVAAVPVSANAQEILNLINSELGAGVIEALPLFSDVVVRVRPEAWRQAAEVARDKLACDYITFVSGIDWMPAPKEEGAEADGDTSTPAQPTEMTPGAAGAAGRFQVFAHVQSTTRHWGITFKADLDENDPHIESWVSVYPGADWHERECAEMFGFKFDGHPNLRLLYLPAAFEGHPLRKDFPLLARVVKPWPGIVNVEGMPESDSPEPDSPAVATTENPGA